MIYLYFHTIRYLKFIQIFYRILYFFYKPKVFKNSEFKLRSIKKKLNTTIKKRNSLNKYKFNFLNQSFFLSKIKWNGHEEIVSKLWRYNQHYFDYLNSANAYNEPQYYHSLLNKWINENKSYEEIGWEPYPTSLRIVNWIKWHLLGNDLSMVCIQSLALQARLLNRRVEWHLLGNHLFSNAKALIFVGLFFSDNESKKWLNKGLKIIKEQIEEQVLDDGGNFELSPMYHSIFLEDILDLINIIEVYDNQIEKNFIIKLKKTSKKMLKWLDIMTFPDGEISFFNDSAFKIASKFNQLNHYAKRLGIKYINCNFAKLTQLKDSGYIRYTSNEASVILDVGRLGPNYLLGHAHADTLSFEMSLFGKRFLVNGGTSDYSIGDIRVLERGSKSHNTVTVNEQNSSEVWKSFRVAKRAFPKDLKIKCSKEFVNISCSHDGFMRLAGKPIHKRYWRIGQSSLIVKDIVEGYYENSFAFYHFHPNLKILKIDSKTWSVEALIKKKVIIKVLNGEPSMETSYYSPEFGKRIINKCLKIALDKEKGSMVQIYW